MRALKWLAIALAVLLVVAAVVAWTLPARVAWQALAPRLPLVQLADLDGTIWDGSAGQVRVAGQPVGALEWQTDVLALLHGDLRIQARISGPRIHGHGTLARQWGGTLVVRNATLEIPGSQLAPLLGVASLRFEGPLRVHVDEARIRHAWPVALDASGRWHNVQVHGAAEAAIGSISIEFSEPDPPTVIGVISDSGQGPAAINGRLTATPLGYQLRVRLRPRDPDNMRLQEALSRLGQRQPDGSVLLRIDGTLGLPSLP